jgi:hypothetical protein
VVLFKLLGLPFTIPAAGIKFVFNTLLEQAEADYYDDAPVKEALLLLNMQLEEGEIDEKGFSEREAELFLRLREIRAYREEQLRLELEARAEAGDENVTAVAIDGGHAVIEANLDKQS